MLEKNNEFNFSKLITQLKDMGFPIEFNSL
jgi:hypothetical protein